ncbi:MAG: T9SS type A sorting domain-containing protein [Chitinophagaceae bacterium]|nr:MAG: T9SS type A sorting domain-containing protein [Chitinophagaceae bacterium]
MKKNFLFTVFIFLISLAVYAAAPTASGSNLTFNSIDGKSFTGSFTPGNGSERLVVMREGNPVTTLPLNGVKYTVGAQFNVQGEVVVQASSWASFSPSNLKPGTVYYFAIFEFNGSGTTTEYLMLPLTGNQMTTVAPTLASSSLSNSNIVGNALTLSWTKGNGSGRIVLARKDAPVNGTPADLSFYYGDESFGNGGKIGAYNFIVYRGSGSSVTVKNLEPNTTYHFAVFEFNGSNTPVYLPTPTTTSAITNAGPTVAGTSAGFNWVEGNSFTISSSGGNGSQHLFIAKKGSPVTSAPTNGATYVANASFGSGQELEPGEFVIGAGTSTSVALKNLEAGTQYYFRVYEYDVDKNGNTYYLTSSYLSKSGSTQGVPTVLASSINLVSLTGSTARIGLTNGSGSYRTVFMKEGSAVDAAPENFKTYGSDAIFGNGPQLGTGNYIITWGMNGSPFTVNNLKAGKTYHLAVYEFNGNGAPVYSTSAARFSFSVPVEPTAASKTPSIAFKDGGAFRLSWTNGTGSNRLVVAKKGSAPTFTPVDGTLYTAKESFGTAGSPVADEFIVYNGTNAYVDLTALEIASTYHFKVYDFNLDENGNPDYLTSTWLTASGTTLGYPTTQTTLLPVSNILSTTATINFTGGNGESRLFIMKEGSVPDSIPADYRKYNNNTYGSSASHIGNGNYIINKTSNPGGFSVTNMKPKTTYYVSAYEFNGSNLPAYLRVPAATISFTTADVSGASTPTTAASNATTNGVEGNKFTFKWTNGNGEKRIVVMRKAAAVNFVPADATNYVANAAFGLGTDLGEGQFVVYNNSGNSVEITNLESSTIYHFAVFEYNGATNLIRYLTATTLTTTASTLLAPTIGVSNVNTAIANGALTLSWTAGNGTGRLIVMKEGSAPTAQPADLSTYPANAVFKAGSQMAAGEYVVYMGTGTSVTITGLSNKQYYYSIFEYNGTAAPVYNKLAGVSGSATPSSALPVSLAAFTAKKINDIIELNWATAQEINNSHFIVERSTDANLFETVATVQAAGNSNERKEYSYTDQTPGKGKIYYRLKQVDKDGKFWYSPVQMVEIRTEEKAAIFPNPVVNKFKVLLPKGVKGAMLMLYDMQGRIAINRTVEEGETVDASGLVKGMYVAVIEYSGGTRTQIKLLKQ